jgi:hypothetical protein
MVTLQGSIKPELNKPLSEPKPEPKEQKYPVIQTSSSIPSVLNDKKIISKMSPEELAEYIELEPGKKYVKRPAWVISQESFDILDQKQIEDMEFPVEYCEYTDKETKKPVEVVMFRLPAGMRWIPLSDAVSYYVSKDGIRFNRALDRRPDEKSASWWLFALLTPDNRIILDKTGNPQIFTFKVTSYNEGELKGKYYTPEDNSIRGVNKAIQEATNGSETYNPKVWMAHLSAIQVKSTPKNRASSITGESSSSFGYEVDPDVQILPEDLQTVIDEFVNTPEFKALSKNPKGIQDNYQSDNSVTVDGRLTKVSVNGKYTWLTLNNIQSTDEHNVLVKDSRQEFITGVDLTVIGASVKNKKGEPYIYASEVKKGLTSEPSTESYSDNLHEELPPNPNAEYGVDDDDFSNIPF